MKIKLSDPILVYAPKVTEENSRWGVYAIPRMWREPNGDLVIRFNGEADSADTENMFCAPNLYFVSKDNGTVPAKLYLVLAYAVLPAICEEFIFRGIVCLEYENGGVMRSVVFSALFFGMLHFDLTNLPVYIFSGAVLALTLYATRSLFGAITVHFLYNLFGLFGQPYMNALYNLTGSTNFFIFFATTLFLLSAIVFCAEASRLYRQYLYKNYSAKYRQPVNTVPQTIRDSYIEVIKAPSAIACLCVYIIALLISWL